MKFPSVSFIHCGGEKLASYRYRVMMPHREFGAQVNNREADVLIFSKPQAHEVEWARVAKDRGQTVIVDYCDMHFGWQHYREIMQYADMITCPTKTMADWMKADFDVDVTVIADPYEQEEKPPHVTGGKLLWFGNSMNYFSIEKWLPFLDGELCIISSSEVPKAIPWSPETMRKAFAWADIVLLPETAPYKGANRAVEATRQGLFVVADFHPALDSFPGIWQGSILEGIKWAQANLAECNSMVSTAQAHVSKTYAPAILASAWKQTILLAQSYSMSAAGKSTGTDG